MRRQGHPVRTEAARVHSARRETLREGHVLPEITGAPVRREETGQDRASVPAEMEEDRVRTEAAATSISEVREHAQAADSAAITGEEIQGVMIP